AGTVSEDRSRPINVGGVDGDAFISDRGKNRGRCAAGDGNALYLAGCRPINVGRVDRERVTADGRQSHRLRRQRHGVGRRADLAMRLADVALAAHAGRALLLGAVRIAGCATRALGAALSDVRARRDVAIAVETRDELAAAECAARLSQPAIGNAAL